MWSGSDSKQTFDMGMMEDYKFYMPDIQILMLVLD